MFDFGASPQTVERGVATKNVLKGLHDLKKDVHDLNNGNIDPINYIAGQVGKYSGMAIFSLSKFLTMTVSDAGGAIGDKLHSALFGNVADSRRVTLNSPTAGTTPMAILNIPQASSNPSGLPTAQISSGRGNAGGTSSGNQSFSTRTAGAGIFGGLMTAINKTQNAGPSGNSGSTSSFGINNSSGGGLVPKTGGQTTISYVPTPAPKRPESS